MKYIDAEKLKAEIERLKEETSIGICEYDKGLENGRMEVLTSLQSTIDSLQQEQTEEHPDNFTSFEWLVGRLMFRGCDLWGMTDGEDDNGVVTKLIKDRAAEMMELLERKLDSNAEPVDLMKEIRKHTDLFQADMEYPLRLTAIKFYELGKKGGSKWKPL